MPAMPMLSASVPAPVAASKAPPSPQGKEKSDRQVVQTCLPCVAASRSGQMLVEPGLLTDFNQQVSGEFRITCDNLTHSCEYDHRQQEQKRHLNLLGVTLRCLLTAIRRWCSLHR